MIRELLGRDEAYLDLEKVRDELKGKTVMVTGAAGSIGSAVCIELTNFRLKSLIILDFDESRTFELMNELKNWDSKLKVIPSLTNITDQRDLEDSIRTHKPYCIIHCAAYKHVTLMQSMPDKAIKNNVFGLANCIYSAKRNDVKYFIFLSTDKAVYPSNIMGLSKRLAETYVFSMDNPNYKVVRLCNVLGSRGSVLPIWEKQLEAGYINVTSKKVKRYFISDRECAESILDAITSKNILITPGDYVEEIKIVELAK